MPISVRDVRALVAELRRASGRERDEADHAPSLSLRDVACGELVRVVARVTASASATSPTSPITGEHAAYLRVERFTSSHDEGSLSWELLSDDVLGDALAIADATGEAIVKLAGARVLIDPEDVSDEARDKRSSNFGVRVLQSAIREGDVVEVVGRASIEASEPPSYRVPPARRLIFAHDPRDPVLRVRKLEA
jgi:hypothetical protein